MIIFIFFTDKHHPHACTCHVPRQKVVAGINKSSHFRKESSPFSVPATVELERWLNLDRLPMKKKQKNTLSKSDVLFKHNAWKKDSSILVSSLLEIHSNC